MIAIKINYSNNVSSINVKYDDSPVFIKTIIGDGSGGAAVWGGITGTLSNQTDLQTALNGKFDDPTGTTLQYLRGDGSLAAFPSLTGYVPYSGATSAVNLGEYGISAGQFTLDVSPTGTASVGTTQWNDTIGSSQTTLKGGSVVLKNGVDLVARVVNKVSPNTTLTKAAYQAVRVSGAQGQRLAVAFAQANTDNNSADTIGLVVETIATNQEGFIITVGQIEGINTTGSLQGETWADGDVLYLSPTIAGALTNVKPTGATGHIVIIGYVEYAHANNGKIYVKVMNGWELDELHNVYISSVSNNQGLFYESSSSLWKNKSISTVLGYTPEQPLTFSTPLSRSTNTVSIPAASSSANGYLSSTDWSTFNGKQNALTNPVTGTGTTNELAYFSGTSAISSLTTATYPSLTELSYVKGVTSAIQTQLNAKQATLNGSGFVKISGTTISYDNSTYLTSSTVLNAVLTTYTVGSNTEVTSSDTIETAIEKLQGQVNARQGTITLTTTGTSGAATLVGNTLNIPQYSGGGGGGGMVIGGTITSATAGSILFAGVSGVLAQDNSNLFWDDTNNRLGIGKSTPSTTLDVLGNITINTLTQGILISNRYITGTDGRNIFIGGGGQSITGGTGANSSYNLSCGYTALNALTNGYYNHAIGFESSLSITTATGNTSFGFRSLKTNITGSDNTAIGTNALRQNTAGANTAVGSDSLINNVGGNYNTAVGLTSLRDNIGGIYNTAVGAQSLLVNSSGNNNVAVGLQAGYTNSTGSNNIFIGYQSVGASATESNRAWIGNGSTASTWLGGNVIIGTTTNAGYKLDCNGTLRANQFYLSALNSTPASATATGTLGEIRIDANYIYVCTATNTWKRSAISTW
jgi:nitrogen fixation protein